MSAGCFPYVFEGLENGRFNILLLANSHLENGLLEPGVLKAEKVMKGCACASPLQTKDWTSSVQAGVLDGVEGTRFSSLNAAMAAAASNTSCNSHKQTKYNG